MDNVTAALMPDRVRPPMSAPRSLGAATGIRVERQSVAASGWDAAAAVFFTLAAVAIAAGGFYLSFDAVSAAMRPAFGSKAPFVPIIIDSSIFVFSGVDVVLARLRIGHPLVRLVPIAGTTATVWLNVGAGGGNSAVIAHACMPSVFVAFTEVSRHVVRRRSGLADATPREGIPIARWLVDPVRSLLLWRRMVLWDIRSFDLALEREFRRQEVVAAMRDAHGLGWRWKVGGHTRLRIQLGLFEVPATPDAQLTPDSVRDVVTIGEGSDRLDARTPAASAQARRPEAAAGRQAASHASGSTRPSPPSADEAAGDRRESARAVYSLFQAAHRALPSKLFSDLTGYSYWQARRLLEVFGREMGPIDVTEHSDSTRFIEQVRRQFASPGADAPGLAVNGNRR